MGVELKGKKRTVHTAPFSEGERSGKRAKEDAPTPQIQIKKYLRSRTLRSQLKAAAFRQLWVRVTPGSFRDLSFHKNRS